MAGKSPGLWLQVCSPYNYSTNDTIVLDSFLLCECVCVYCIIKKHRNQFYLSLTFREKKHIKLKQIKIYYPSITSINHLHLSQKAKGGDIVRRNSEIVPVLSTA